MIERTSKGFTIVELIVAMVVGTIVVASASLIIISQVHLSQRGRDLIILNAYVENKIESLRSIGYLGLSDGTTDIAGELPAELNAPRSGTLQISPQSTGLKKIDVSISYNDQGANRIYSYSTFLGELGVGQY